jgi:acyl-CoA synthetase (AMP-forming)/AMP-acid ligase II
MHEVWSLLELGCQPSQAARRLAWQGDGWRTHADFNVRLNRWQHAFAARSGSTWAVYADDPLDFAAALFGAWHAGKTVVVPGDDRPATVAALKEMGCGLAGDLPDALHAVVDTTTDIPISRQALDARMTKLTLFTSGSQGEPQPIDKMLAQLWAEVQVLEQTFGARMDAGNRGLPTVWSTVSHQHIYGLLFLVLWPLATGRPLGTRRLLYPEDMIHAMSGRPSVLVTTPAHLRRLGEHVGWSGVRSSLSAVFSSGGPLPWPVSQAAAELLGSVPIEVFGSSETGGIAWRQATDVDQAWMPFSGVQWRVEGGCLVVRSPCLRDDAWWTTADRAEPSHDGSFRLLGRQDRIVKIEEKRVSMTAIERALLATPWVQDARALLIPTPIGDRVGVVAVLSAEGRLGLAQQGRRAWGQMLREALRDSFEAMALPRRWRFVEAMPIDAQGKTPQGLLQSAFLPQSTRSVPMPEMPSVTWLKRDEQDALASLCIHAGLSVFEGHFPAAPILPGVAQLDWALMLARECFALPTEFVRLEALKFVNPVVPGTTLYLSLHRHGKAAEPDLAAAKFRLYSLEDDAGGAEVATEHASGRGVWRADKARADV